MRVLKSLTLWYAQASTRGAGEETFSAELEAVYKKWQKEKVRWRLDRGTSLSRAIVLAGIVHLLVDLAHTVSLHACGCGCGCGYECEGESESEPRVPGESEPRVPEDRR